MANVYVYVEAVCVILVSLGIVGYAKEKLFHASEFDEAALALASVLPIMLAVFGVMALKGGDVLPFEYEWLALAALSQPLVLLKVLVEFDKRLERIEIRTNNPN
ncbi:MAG: hypothetical protein L7F78_05000 [Syntrophales bacterium LBB04]|nr:hypothetical protein [Syntrophales bacterium LBB04]